jgi:hypothetical protein
MSNLVEIMVTAKNLTGPTMAAVNAEVDKTSKMKLLNKTAGLAAAGFAVIGVEAVKMASKFDSEMTLLQTQAGVSADKIGGLKKGVLASRGRSGRTRIRWRRPCSTSSRTSSRPASPARRR